MDSSLTEKLIEAVKQRPVLYLSSHRDFKKKSCVIQAWKEVQEELHEDVEVVRSKWKNLKDTYKKCKNARDGKGVHSLSLVNWLWSEQMSFLDTEIPPPQSTTANHSETLLFPDIKQENISESEESNSEITCKDRETGQTEDILKSFEVNVFHNSNDKYLSLKRKKMEQTDKSKINSNKRNRNNDDTSDAKIEVSCDRVDLFFLGLAHSFKELSHRTQINAKFELVKVLRDAELSDLEDKE